jgi:F420-0:gamma-glutamyl ligase
LQGFKVSKKMERLIGTTARGIRAPIIRQGDDVTAIVTEIITKLWKNENISPKDKDIVAITESVVARAQGNYAGIDAIAKDVYQKFGNNTLGVIFPILSRNRFAIPLKGISKGVANGSNDIILMLNYPSDEVGNQLFPEEILDNSEINLWEDVLTIDQYRSIFGFQKHPFTGVDYVSYYEDIIAEQGINPWILFSNNPKTILKYSDSVLNCDIHNRNRTKSILRKSGAKNVYGLDEILTESIKGSGYNPEYGLLGSNKASEESVKLFPRDCNALVNKIQKNLNAVSNKIIEVMIYGDGAFKDPLGKIWELADPVVSPGYTSGLEGTPNELKIKYLADNKFAHLNGKELDEAISKYVLNKNSNLTTNMESQGTTPRRLTDLIGSLCDLTSGSGDKGTPIVYIQGYFDNYSK